MFARGLPLLLLLILTLPLPCRADDTAAVTNPEVVRIRAALDESGSAAYRIHALRVGVSRRAPRSAFIKGSDLPRRIEVAFSFWVLQGAGRVILVDTGW